jgi:hypothetical protein
MRRMLTALLVTLAVVAVAAPTATAARWLAGGGTGGDPSSSWTTSSFSAPVGVVDIYSVCSSHGAVSYSIAVRPAGGGNTVSQGYTLPCDGRGRWLRRVGIPRNTRLEARAVAKDRRGIPCSLSGGITRCATGYTSVWSSW